MRIKYEQWINNARRPQKHDLTCITSILSSEWLTVHVLLSLCSADIVVSDHIASTVYTPRPSYGAKNMITMAHCASNYQWAVYSRRLSTNNDMYFSWTVNYRNFFKRWNKQLHTCRFSTMFVNNDVPYDHQDSVLSSAAFCWINCRFLCHSNQTTT